MVLGGLSPNPGFRQGGYYTFELVTQLLYSPHPIALQKTFCSHPVLINLSPFKSLKHTNREMASAILASTSRPSVHALQPRMVHRRSPHMIVRAGNPFIGEVNDPEKTKKRVDQKVMQIALLSHWIPRRQLLGFVPRILNVGIHIASPVHTGELSPRKCA